MILLLTLFLLYIEFPLIGRELIVNVITIFNIYIPLLISNRYKVWNSKLNRCDRLRSSIFLLKHCRSAINEYQIFAKPYEG